MLHNSNISSQAKHIFTSTIKRKCGWLFHALKINVCFRSKTYIYKERNVCFRSKTYIYKKNAKSWDLRTNHKCHNAYKHWCYHQDDNETLIATRVFLQKFMLKSNRENFYVSSIQNSSISTASLITHLFSEAWSAKSTKYRKCSYIKKPLSLHV